ncbi:MbcA/ParS/Xre antitoxin family protein [Pseudomonas fakonensis]|uniref:MbcA/ParS/Xre antitoxin family protein n=1 Tax=Pseudomonas fakonensis TaxID=2842355 RepID=A0ABX8NBW6_9PSED|nr:MbcA/ParS/Xre antitoxin family protein [Pseudomonas fakonensis]QXH53310.1 MbcA/ParS/Xre antitoxin family protein [Pseudomonas fakonensis]
MDHLNQALAEAERVFGDREKAAAWMSQPRAVFSNRSALQLACDEVGYQKVKDELSRLEHGFGC